MLSQTKAHFYILNSCVCVAVTALLKFWFGKQTFGFQKCSVACFDKWLLIIIDKRREWWLTTVCQVWPWHKARATQRNICKFNYIYIYIVEFLEIEVKEMHFPEPLHKCKHFQQFFLQQQGRKHTTTWNRGIRPMDLMCMLVMREHIHRFKAADVILATVYQNSEH